MTDKSVNKLLRDIALTFIAGIVIGVLNLKQGPTHIAWEDFRTILDGAIRSGLLVPMAAALAPFYPEYGVGSATATTAPAKGIPDPPVPTISQLKADVPDYTKPNI